MCLELEASYAKSTLIQVVTFAVLCQKTSISFFCSVGCHLSTVSSRLGSHCRGYPLQHTERAITHGDRKAAYTQRKSRLPSESASTSCHAPWRSRREPQENQMVFAAVRPYLMLASKSRNGKGTEKKVVPRSIKKTDCVCPRRGARQANPSSTRTRSATNSSVMLALEGTIPATNSPRRG